MNTGLDIAIVADDLTGALDAAAPFADRGMPTHVAVTLEGLEAALGGGQRQPRVVAVNTDSRHLGREEAARRAVEAAERLLVQRPRLLLKKVDSTLRGQVVAESTALWRLGGRRLLVCPAVPSQGRCVREGQVWVDGEPLSASAYAGDALSPPLTGPLDRAFEADGVSLARCRFDPNRPDPAPQLPPGDCVVDADDDAVLGLVATQLLEAPGEWLPVCAAGLTQALAQRLAQAQGMAQAPRPPALPRLGRAVLAVGSRTPRARRQLELLRDAFPDVAWLPACGRPRHQDPGPAGPGVTVIVPGVPGGEAQDAAAVAATMADTVAAVAAEGPGALLFLSGGDIAQAVLERLRGEFIELCGEWCPGVPLGHVNGDAARPAMTKAGGFGQEGLLVQLVAGIRHSSQVG